MKATDYLRKGADLLEERGKEYDNPEGERSMGKCVTAFNAITGRDLTESEGWLLLQVLKDVRQWRNPGRFHADSAEDCISYAALKAEALVRDANAKSEYMGFPPLDDHGAAIEPASEMQDDSERMAAIGQNGNDGAAYDDGRPSWDESPGWASHLLFRPCTGKYEFGILHRGEYRDHCELEFIIGAEDGWEVVSSRPQKDS